MSDRALLFQYSHLVIDPSIRDEDHKTWDQEADGEEGGFGRAAVFCQNGTGESERLQAEASPPTGQHGNQKQKS